MRISDIRPETILVDGIERPTTNSLGKPIHTNENALVAFWRWFNDSVLVDDQKRPLVLYHGTPSKVDKKFAFDMKYLGSTGRSMGNGFYVTPDKFIAQHYGKVVSLYVSVNKILNLSGKKFNQRITKNLLKAIAIEECKVYGIDFSSGFLSNYGDIDAYGINYVLDEATKLSSLYNSCAVDQISEISNNGVSPVIVNRVLRTLLGYDVIFSDGIDNTGGSPIYVVLNNHDIKAIKNDGNFSNTPLIFS